MNAVAKRCAFHRQRVAPAIRLAQAGRIIAAGMMKEV